MCRTDIPRPARRACGSWALFLLFSKVSVVRLFAHPTHQAPPDEFPSPCASLLTFALPSPSHPRPALRRCECVPLIEAVNCRAAPSPLSPYESGQAWRKEQPALELFCGDALSTRHDPIVTLRRPSPSGALPHHFSHLSATVLQPRKSPSCLQSPAPRRPPRLPTCGRLRAASRRRRRSDTSASSATGLSVGQNIVRDTKDHVSSLSYPSGNTTWRGRRSG